ncbi:MAG: hypothetical protein R3F55_20035 [Alphaproteobacteria bacterium]
MHAASAGFAEARAIYTTGRKSDNKLHVNPGSFYAAGDLLQDEPLLKPLAHGETVPAYEHRRRSAMRRLNAYRQTNPVNPQTFLQFGKGMLAAPPTAANCGELALMAAASAWHRLGEQTPAPVALVMLDDPADHMFCVVGDHEACGDLMFVNAVRDLATNAPAADMWVADPWLNVMCRLRDYPARAAAKFAKWQQANKRIAWETGPLGPGWYSPLGDYSDGFRDATMIPILG